MTFEAIVKDVNIKTLVSGDKSGRVVFELTNPDEVIKLAALATQVQVVVEVKDE